MDDAAEMLPLVVERGLPAIVDNRRIIVLLIDE